MFGDSAEVEFPPVFAAVIGEIGYSGLVQVELSRRFAIKGRKRPTGRSSF